MADTEQPSPITSISLSLLEEQEKKYKVIMNSAQLKEHITSLKFGLRSLDTFGNSSCNEGLKRCIRRVAHNVMLELHSLSRRQIDGSFSEYLDSAYSNLREKMKNAIINPETGEYDVIFSKFFESDTVFKRAYSFVLKNARVAFWKTLAEPRREAYPNASSINEKLQFLIALLECLKDNGVGITKESKEHLTPLLDRAACLLFLWLVGKTDEEMELAMKHNLSNLLESNKLKEICLAVLINPKALASNKNLLKNESNLLDIMLKLLDRTSKYIIDLNDECEKLHDKLKFFRTYLADLPHEVKSKKLEYLVPSIEAIASKALDIMFLFYDKFLKEDDVTEMNGALAEVIDQIEDIQAEVEEIMLYNYPKTDDLGFLDLFLGRVEVLKCRPGLIKILKSQIEIWKDEFHSLRSFLVKIKDQRSEHEELEDIWKRIIHLAYQAEHVIDSYLVKGISDRHFKLTVSKIVEKIKPIQLEATRIKDEKKYVTQAHTVAKTSSNVLSQSTDTTDEVVGFEDEAEKIMEYLVGDMRKLDVISIVGMPGLGKTTLAKNMYEAPSLVEYFHVRAWCSVSQTYRKRELLLTILGDVIKLTDEIKKLTDQELVEKLCRSLRGRRYLIVIDDLWDIEAWNDLRRSFPENQNHSRILITSRLLDVASQTNVGSKVHLLREFSDKESWELFEKKLLQKATYSEDFLEVGKQIVKNCKGLPLAIVVIAGVLGKVEKRIHEWNKIAGSLSLHIFSDSQSQCKAILELSYYHLPDHLKSCFLYFGAFAEDEEILVRKLKSLWIAEEFVRSTKSLEDVAEEYFMDLVNRSLVTASIESSLGRVKTCRVHDLVRDFCLEKAQEECFLQVIRFDDRSSFSGMYDQTRLSTYTEVDGLFPRGAFGYSVRSLLHKAPENSSFYDLSFIARNFKLLRVLDLRFIQVLEYFSGIESLIHLRYLAYTNRIASIPSSISNLWNLQYFFLEANEYHRYRVVHVPDSFWDMVNLRHVHIIHRARFHIDASRPKNSTLYNLETLSTPCLVYGEDAENLLRRLPKLRKLSCIFYIYRKVSSKCNRFPVMDFLDQLISLKVIFDGPVWRKMCLFNFPSNLQKLTLWDLRIMWDEITKFGRTLPNLKVLKVMEGGSNKTWIVKDGDFPNLKYLKLGSVRRLRNWIALEDSFPVLEQLVLSLLDLKEIPSCFGEISTLRMITVKNCKPSVDGSARRIQMEQHEELQNVDLKVYIYPREDSSDKEVEEEDDEKEEEENDDDNDVEEEEEEDDDSDVEEDDNVEEEEEDDDDEDEE